MPDSVPHSVVAPATAVAPANKPPPQPPRPPPRAHAEALQALGKALPSAVEKSRLYLDALLAVFADFELQEPANGLLDVKVLAAIESSAPYLAEYREFLAVVVQEPDNDDLLACIGDFLAAALAYKRLDGGGATYCHLWCDGYRYLLREWFLTSVTFLLRAQRYAAVSALLARRYSAPRTSAGGGESFVAFDGYVKTLDEFRCRRLGLHRVSLSADLLQQRLDEVATPLADVMQCDFLLCLHSLLHSDDRLRRWYPRSLVFADAYSQQGFDLFVTGADPARFGAVATLLGVRDRDELVARFDALEVDFNLPAWGFGGVRLDFRGFLGWRKAALRSKARPARPR